jgi:hypothetical protein
MRGCRLSHGFAIRMLIETIFGLVLVVVSLLLNPETKGGPRILLSPNRAELTHMPRRQ